MLCANRAAFMKPQLIVIPVLLTLTAALVINMNPAPESPAKTVEEQQALSFTEDFLRRFTGSDTDLATCRFSQKQFPGDSHEHEEHAGMTQVLVEGSLYDDRTFRCCVLLNPEANQVEMERAESSGRQVFPRYVPQFEGTPEDLLESMEGITPLIAPGGRRAFPGGPVQLQLQQPALNDSTTMLLNIFMTVPTLF